MAQAQGQRSVISTLLSGLVGVAALFILAVLLLVVSGSIDRSNMLLIAAPLFALFATTAAIFYRLL